MRYYGIDSDLVNKLNAKTNHILESFDAFQNAKDLEKAWKKVFNSNDYPSISNVYSFSNAGGKGDLRINIIKTKKSIAYFLHKLDGKNVTFSIDSDFKEELSGKEGTWVNYEDETDTFIETIDSKFADSVHKQATMLMAELEKAK